MKLGKKNATKATTERVTCLDLTERLNYLRHFDLVLFCLSLGLMFFPLQAVVLVFVLVLVPKDMLVAH